MPRFDLPVISGGARPLILSGIAKVTAKPVVLTGFPFQFVTV